MTRYDNHRAIAGTLSLTEQTLLCVEVQCLTALALNIFATDIEYGATAVHNKCPSKTSALGVSKNVASKLCKMTSTLIDELDHRHSSQEATSILTVGFEQLLPWHTFSIAGPQDEYIQVARLLIEGLREWARAISLGQVRIKRLHFVDHVLAIVTAAEAEQTVTQLTTIEQVLHRRDEMTLEAHQSLLHNLVSAINQLSSTGLATPIAFCSEVYLARCQKGEGE